MAASKQRDTESVRMTNSNVIQSQRPKHIPEYAEACLQALAAGNLGEKISLGGAFGLLHYLDYRSTHDVDARWAPRLLPKIAAK